MVVARLHEKCFVGRSQSQAISKVASGVNKLADVTAKGLNMKEKGWEPLLSF